MITNTNSVGLVRDAVLKWGIKTNWYGERKPWYIYPVVAEIYNGFLNDIYDFHVKEARVLEAISFFIKNLIRRYKAYHLDVILVG
ncbi:MAG: P1 family peptidase [Cyclobacteriaceae bacterium]|jgi:D-aminopeptidase|nr:P1 family peptidase [Cyclobacteriaceae bacterium]